MDFHKFADLMESIGFRSDEPVAPTFRLNRNDLKSPAFRNGYTKVVGNYRVCSIWSQSGEVAFWARESTNNTQLFHFHKEEIDYLAKKKKFRKN